MKGSISTHMPDSKGSCCFIGVFKYGYLNFTLENRDRIELDFQEAFSGPTRACETSIRIDIVE